ncbi:MAG: tetratricopeptide repeat protein [Chthoniobacterales bacterium]
MRFTVRALSLLLVAGSLNSFGQEIRRAIPVQPATASPTATPKELPTAPAVPFSFEDISGQTRPTPRPTPREDPLGPVIRPTPTNVPLTTPSVAPSSTPQEVQALPTPDADGSIRLAPGSAQKTSEGALQLEVANGFYSRKMYDLAVPEYEKLLIQVPKRGDPLRQQALFRLAESHRFLTNVNAAQESYAKLLSEFNSGPFIGASAYRLAEILYADKNYAGALQMFRKAYANSSEADVKLTARFYEARSLDGLKQRKEAEPVYREVSTWKGQNPYKDFAILYLAEAAVANGHKDEAYAQYLALSTNAEKPSMRTEAAFRAAALAAEQGQKAKARELYNKVARSDNEELAAPAKLEALRMAYDLNDYKAVTAISLEAFDKLPGDAMPDAMLLVANSYRQLGDYKKAEDFYDRLVGDFPKTTAARDAHFHRLVNLYSMDDKNTLPEIDEFLLLTSNPKERNQANLLKAELLFKDKKFAEAGKIYAELEHSDLADNFRADALYKLGWCQAHNGDYTGAATTFTHFVERYPKHEFVPTAIAQRALSNQQNKNYDVAIKDFDLLIEKYPNTPERELAMQQKALLLGQQQKTEEMVAVFEKLLADYPKSAASAQANFWIGWAAYGKENYPLAIEKLNLARTQDAAQYGDRATIRIAMAQFYLKDREATAKEIAKLRKENIPPEILRWLGSQYIEEGNYAKAEQFLLPLTKQDPSIPVSPEIFMSLTQAQLNQKKWKDALASIERYLSTARDPISRTRGLLAYSQAQIGLKKYDEAQKAIDDALMLQPEGRWNAEARMLQAEVAFSKDDFDAAARQFMTIALLYDDKTITPRALLKAREAFQRANNSIDADKAPQTKVSSQKNP